MSLVNKYRKSQIQNKKSNFYKRNLKMMKIYNSFRLLPESQGGLGLPKSLPIDLLVIPKNETNDRNFARFLAHYCDQLVREIHSDPSKRLKNRLRSMHGFLSYCVAVNGFGFAVA